MTIYSKIKSMLAYIRTWLLVNRIAKYHLIIECAWISDGTESKRYKKLVKNLNISENEELILGVESIPLDKFLEYRAKKYLFGLTDKHTKTKRGEIDLLYLEQASQGNRPLVKIFQGKDIGFDRDDEKYYWRYIRIAPKGMSFASLSNGFNGFLKEYKSALIIIIAIFTSPWLLKIWNLIKERF